MNRNRRTVLIFAACLGLAAAIAVLGSERIAERVHLWRYGAPALRVASFSPERQATVLSPYGPGFERELVASFCRKHACRPVWLDAGSREEALRLMETGAADLMVGFGGNAADLDPADSLPLMAGSAYAHFRPIKVRGASLSPALPDTDAGAAMGRALRDLSRWPLVSAAMDFGDDEEDALLLDPAAYSLWLPLMTELRTEEQDLEIPYRWFWRADSGQAQDLAAFWADKDTESLLAELIERYYAFLPRRALPGEIMDLADMVQTRLPKYRDVIENAARENNIPPLLLVALIYQESRFRPDAVSATRVRGIMQLTRSTADSLGVDRLDPEQCIRGGARYLADQYRRAEGRAATPWDQWFMAIAAYNQGPGSLSGAIRIAREKGMEGTRWADLKRSYPLLVNSRGNEAVRHVERIRYYHFILHGLATLAPVEAQDLASLLADGPRIPTVIAR